MNDNKNKVNKLAINKAFKPTITPQEVKEAMPILKAFVESYYENKDTMEINDWLNMEFKKHLPEENTETIKVMSSEIIENVALQEEKHESLKADVAKGRTKEGWLNAEMQKATVNMSALETQRYYQEIDSALFDANKNMVNVALTKDGLINQNPSLDGFIAEQHHVETFNINAKASGSEYYAEVVPPSDTGFDKDSVDIVIKDKDGNIVKEYQSKFYKDAKSTEKAFEHGDYTGQEKLVPEGQASDMNVEASEVIEAPDGTKSKPISKSDAKNMQEAAQDKNGDGKPTEYTYDNVSNKDLAKQMVTQVGISVALGGVIGAGGEIIRQVSSKEELDDNKIIKKGVETAIDGGIKTALVGGVQVCAKKGIIKALGKNPSVAVISGIVQVGVENVKIVKKIAEKKVTIKEGISQMELVSMGVVGSTIGSIQGAKAGVAIGTIFGPVGAVVGGVMGGIVGSTTGGFVGQQITKVKQKIKSYIEKTPPIIVNPTNGLVPVEKAKVYAPKQKTLALAGGGSTSSSGGGIISTCVKGVTSFVKGVASLFGF